MGNLERKASWSFPPFTYITVSVLGAVGLEFICPFDPLLPWNIVGKGLGGVVSPDNWEIGKKRELAFPPVTYTLTVSFLQNITQGESSVKTCVSQKVHYTTYKIYHPALPSPLTSCEPIPSSQKYEGKD